MFRASGYTSQSILTLTPPGTFKVAAERVQRVVKSDHHFQTIILNLSTLTQNQTAEQIVRYPLVRLKNHILYCTYVVFVLESSG